MGGGPTGLTMELAGLITSLQSGVVPAYRATQPELALVSLPTLPDRHKLCSSC